MPRSPRSPLSIVQRFLATEAAGGAILLVAAVVALAWANSPWRHAYGSTLGDHHVHRLVDDGLMAVFFFVVGLEVKREALRGELADLRLAALPVIAAVGGMVVPAALFAAIANGTEAGHGWGIPMATDIAFAIGVLMLLGTRVPSGLRVLLLTLAIADDIGAIVVIAVFYSRGFRPLPLLGAASGVAAFRFAARWPPAAVVVACATWFLADRSGVHPTIAGVALAWALPTTDERLEEALHPWASFVVLPAFALVNAGVHVDTASLDARVIVAVAVGLVVGKFLGIFGAAALAVRTRVAALPAGVRWGHVAGVACLGGIGFTVSLFISGLAGAGDSARIAVLGSSVAAAALGSGVLLLATEGGTTAPAGR